MPTVFLSHSSSDKKAARRLATDIMMSNVGVWFDEWEIHVGHSITQKISRGLENADFVVVLLSKNSVESGWVQKEWATRIGEEANSKSVCVLPIMLENCDVPVLLRDKRYADLRNDYTCGIRDLIDAIRFHAANDKPITAGALIQSGRIVYDHSIPDIPILRGLINSIEGGCFERSEEGLQAHVQVVCSHQSMQAMSERMGSNRLELLCSDYCVSVDPDNPSVFRCVQEFNIPKGEMIPDISSGQWKVLPSSVFGSSETIVEAYADCGVIQGNFHQAITYDASVPIPKVQVRGTFKAIIAL